MSGGSPVRLLLWSDRWPAVYPADAGMERVPWTTRPEHVASRAEGLAAQAVAVCPAGGPDEAAGALSALRRHTALPLWLIVADPAHAGTLPAGLEPVRLLRDLDPRVVAAALAEVGSATRPGGGDPLRTAPRADPVVTVFAPGGGAGASTLAAALARTLAGWSLPTVAADLNLHAPVLAVVLGTWTAAGSPAGLEPYLRDPATPPVPVPGSPGLRLVPGLEALENLDDVTVGGVVALLERLGGGARVLDTAPVVTDPAVYAALRSASHTVLVSDDGVSSRLQLKRYRRLFLQLGLGWRDALLVVNHSRPSQAGPSPAEIEEELGLRPLVTLPYRPSLLAAAPPRRLEGAWRTGVEMLAATIVGRRPPRPPGWRGRPHRTR